MRYHDTRSLIESAIEKLEVGYPSSEDIISYCSQDIEEKGYIPLGLHPGELTVVATRPGMGKHVLALQLAMKVALDSAKPLLVFSLNQSAYAVMLRLFSALGNISYLRLRSGHLVGPDWENLTGTVARLIRHHISIVDEAALPLNTLFSEAQKWANDNGEPGIVLIDDLQRIILSDTKNEYDTVRQKITTLKQLAQTCHTPVVVLSDLNRNLESRENKSPMLSDLPGCGAIESIADLILLLYRKSIYCPETKNEALTEAQAIRLGDDCVVNFQLDFNAQYQRFEKCKDHEDE